MTSDRVTGKKILIFGGWFGSRNAGDEAILLGLKALLEEAFPGCRLYAHSIDAEYTREVCGVEPVFAPPGRSFAAKAAALAGAYRSMDLIVVSGGTPIFDYYLLSRAFHFGVPLASGVPMAFLGIGLKPIRSRFGKWFYRNILKRARFIAVRDPEVLEHLRGMGLTSDVRVTADSAICMAPAPAEQARDQFAAAGLDPALPIVAICPIFLSARYQEHFHEPVSERRRTYSYESLARLADHQVEQGRQVVFIPMHQVPPDDDREVIGFVRRRMRHPAVVMEPPEEPRLVAALLQNVDMLVGMRLHSLVLATAGAVPTVAIGFDMKVGGFMRHLGMETYHVEIDDFTDEQLIGMAEECWAGRVAVRTSLERRLAAWRHEIRVSVEQLAEIVGRE